jgi:hypothetical protein
VTLRLVGLAKREWAMLDGLMASKDVDPLAMPPDRFFSLVYWWAVKDAADQAAVDKFDRQLWRPPKGVAAPKGSPWSPEAETAAFASLASAFGVLTTGTAREGTDAVKAPPTVQP